MFEEKDKKMYIKTRDDMLFLYLINSFTGS